MAPRFRLRLLLTVRSRVRIGLQNLWLGVIEDAFGVAAAVLETWQKKLMENLENSGKMMEKS